MTAPTFLTSAGAADDVPASEEESDELEDESDDVDEDEDDEDDEDDSRVTGRTEDVVERERRPVFASCRLGAESFVRGRESEARPRRDPSPAVLEPALEFALGASSWSIQDGL